MYTYRKNIIIILFICCGLFMGILYFDSDLFVKKMSKNEKLPNDIRWVVKSKEYNMLCKQIYKEAMVKTKKIYSKKNQAVIMDLDETILNNSIYQVENFKKGESFNMQSWAKWVNRSEATLVPGAKEYIELLRALNIQLIFISNRMDERVDATQENLKNLGIFSDKDIYLLRLDKEDKKYVRRKEVLMGTNRMSPHGSFEVIVHIGDAMGDFQKGEVKNNFILPNPMYGKW